MKKILLGFLCVQLYMHTSDYVLRIAPKAIYGYNLSARASLMHASQGFFIKDDDGFVGIHNAYIDKHLREMSSLALYKAMQSGLRLSLSRLDNGDYYLRSYVPLGGGGPLTGQLVYWLTKTSAYGVLVGAAGSAVVLTGGGVVAAGGAAGVNALVGIGLTTAIPAAGGAGAGVAGAVIGAMAVEAGAAGTLAVSTGMTVASTGGLAATATAIEVAATDLGLAATAIPWLP